MGLVGPMSDGYISGQQQLAMAHGVSDVTIQAWEAEGMPVLERGGQGRPNRYRLADTIVWRVDREVKRVREESPRDQLDRLKAQQVAMAIAKDQKMLVPAGEVESALAARIIATRELLLRGRTWAEHDAEQDPVRRKALRGEIVEAALRRVATAPAGDVSDDEEDEDEDATGA